jgi:hypothetical protein
MLLTQRMEDFRLRLTYDCRFTIVDLRTAPPLWRPTNTLTKARSGALSHKNIKNEDRSGYMHENTGLLTKCHAINAAFYTKMHQLHDNRQQSVGLLGRKCTGHVKNRGEGGPRIGSSIHRRSTELVLDGLITKIVVSD